MIFLPTLLWTASDNAYNRERCLILSDLLNKRVASNPHDFTAQPEKEHGLYQSREAVLS